MPNQQAWYEELEKEFKNTIPNYFDEEINNVLQEGNALQVGDSRGLLSTRPPCAAALNYCLLSFPYWTVNLSFKELAKRRAPQRVRREQLMAVACNSQS